MNTQSPTQPGYAAPIIGTGLLLTGGIMAVTNLVKIHEANNQQHVRQSVTQAPVTGQVLDNASTIQQQSQQSYGGYYQLPIPKAGPASNGYNGGQQMTQQSSGSH